MRGFIHHEVYRVDALVRFKHRSTSLLACCRPIIVSVIASVVVIVVFISISALFAASEERLFEVSHGSLVGLSLRNHGFLALLG